MSTWIFLRGLMRETRHWGDFPQIFSAALANHGEDASVIMIDLPGNGQLHLLQSPLLIEDMVEHCRTELMARGIAPPYRLLALSLGAMVAVAWAMRYTQELAGCVLINTSLRPFSPFYRRLRPRNYPRLLAASLWDSGAEDRERLILGMISSKKALHTETLAAWIAYRREFPVTRRNALRQLVAAVRFRAPLRRPATSMLILASRNDQLVDYRCSERLADQWQAPLVLHCSAGHDLPLDDGRWVAAQVRDWLASSK